MGNLLEQTLVNRLNDDLNCAIKSVGGNTSNVHDIFDYADVIRQQLTFRISSCFDVIAGPGIQVKSIKPSGGDCGCHSNNGCNCNNNNNNQNGNSCRFILGNDNCNCQPSCDFHRSNECHCDCNGSSDCGGGYVCNRDHCNCKCHENINNNCDCNKSTLYISSNSDALITRDIELPDGSKMTTEEKTTIQDVFVKLFDEVIPGLAILKSGKVITTTIDGIDKSSPDKLIGNLNPSTKYIRLELARVDHPIYIDVQDLVEESKKYTDDKIEKVREQLAEDAMHYRGRSIVDPLGETGPVVKIGKETDADFKLGDVISYKANEYIFAIIDDKGTEAWTILGDEGKVSKTDLDEVKKDIEKEAQFRKDTDDSIIKLIDEKQKLINDRFATEAEARQNAIAEVLNQMKLEDKKLQQAIQEETEARQNAIAAEAETRQNAIANEAKARQDTDEAILKLVDNKAQQVSQKVAEEAKARQESDDFMKQLLDAAVLDIQSTNTSLKKETETSLHFIGVSSQDPTIGGADVPGITEYHIGDLVIWNDKEYLFVKTLQSTKWVKLGNDLNPDEFVMWKDVSTIGGYELSIENLEK